ncbi:flagellin [Acetobacterium malicum]|uniref:Flagellin n=1 Tax=Acetobacterium malicum TaxID=52692 RepID=A0ABR6YV47_9FIRM|nr:flagellin [Acetobacterium malicum]MBC3899070.1 flagellin [Acetobacterium malicum]
MRINHNITALNTYNKLSANQATTAKSLEKLSSGLKINRAGDNAAGLAISEKMRGQIRGLDQSTSNANDGISLIKTAEGALNETHSILQRMRELAVQSANDTNQGTDREEIQKEVEQLKAEITRISTDTEFNKKTLLNGNYGTQATSSSGATITIDSAISNDIAVGTGTATLAVAATKETYAGTNSISGLAITSGSNDTLILNNTTIKFSAGTYSAAQIVSKINETSTTTGVTAKSSGGQLVLEANKAGTANHVSATGTFATAVAGATTLGVDASVTGIGSITWIDGNKGTVTDGTFKGMKITAGTTSGNTSTIDTTKNDLKMQIGANESQSMSIGIQNMSASSLGVNNIDLSSAASASSAITTIDTAIASVSSERAKLGAYQNRLEHTINNLGTSSENLSSAESRIRDVDMAKEMMEFTKNNILSQAAQSMLAQANQQPQGVLQLLQ